MAAPGPADGPATPTRPDPLLRVGRVFGALLTLGMGAIHVLLWFDGFRAVPIVGVLFLLNALGAAVLAIALVTVPGRLLAVVAGLGALFTAGTLGALVLSLTVGFLGVREIISAPLVPTTLIVETLGSVVLAALAIRARRR